MVVLGCLITFFREEKPENSDNSGHRVPYVLNVLSCINVEAAARVFRSEGTTCPCGTLEQ